MDTAINNNKQERMEQIHEQDSFAAFFPKALNYHAVAGLLTCSPSGRLPIHLRRTVAIRLPEG